MILRFAWIVGGPPPGRSDSELGTDRGEGAPPTGCPSHMAPLPHQTSSLNAIIVRPTGPIFNRIPHPL